MTLFVENPWAIAILGVLTLAILGGGWWQTQRRELAIAWVAALVLFGGLLVLERSIVADAEAVRATLHEIARRAEANDVEGLAQYFHSTASGHRDRLRTEVVLYEVHRVKIVTPVKVKIDRRRQPPQATVDFRANVVLSDKLGVMRERAIPLVVTADFWLEDGAWRCIDYTYDVGVVRR
jgi:hypothetical protein